MSLHGSTDEILILFTPKLLHITPISIILFTTSVARTFSCTSFVPACMEYCCHVWAGAPSCYLELLDKLKNGYAGLLVLHLLPLLNPWFIFEMWPA